MRGDEAEEAQGLRAAGQHSNGKVSSSNSDDHSSHLNSQLSCESHRQVETKQATSLTGMTSAMKSNRKHLCQGPSKSQLSVRLSL